MAQQPLPHVVPGKVVQSVMQVDSSTGWVDILRVTDQGDEWHSWYRPEVGWQGPEHTAQHS